MRRAAVAGDEEDMPERHYRPCLSVAGQSPQSHAALADLDTLCEAHLRGCHSVEVIALAKRPELAAADRIVAIPTLADRLPPPIKRIVGILADVDKVLVGLEIHEDAR